MQVEVEKLEGLGRRLKVVLPSERVEKAYQHRLKEIAKKVRMDGFRPGKAPMDVIEGRFGATVRREVSSELMQASFQQAVTDQKLKIAGSAEVKPGDMNKNQPLTFEVLFETYPEIELKDFAGVTLEKTVAEVTESDLDHMVEKLRRQHANWHEVNRKAAQGDRLLVDFEGFIDKKPFPGGSGKDFQVEIGAQQMIPGFEEGLVGAKAGEDCDVDVEFPADYPAMHLAGKKALFKIKVHKVEAPELPALDDSLAEKVGVKNGGLETLKADVRKNMENTLKQLLESTLKDRVLDKLIELNPITVPEAMVNDEIKHLQQVARQQLAMQQSNKNPDNIQLAREPFVAQARRRVILGLLVSEAVKKYAIKVDKEMVRQKVEEMTAFYPQPEKMAAYYYQNKRLLSEIETVILENQVVDKLLSQATLNNQSSNYKDIVEQAYKQGKMQ